MASFEKAHDLWVYWDVRVLILVSLFIQVVLTLIAPLRKCSASGVLKLCIWLFYLSASAVALYVISQIKGNSEGSLNADLLAFWAPFLLLHLGGPDTITALALEDNELWLRHVLELVTQVVVSAYVFINTALKSDSWIRIPTMLMFFDGLFKYFERTQALYRASIDSFRDSLETEAEPGPNYARLMDVYYSSTTANIPTVIQGKDDPSSEDSATMKEGYPSHQTQDHPSNNMSTFASEDPPNNTKNERVDTDDRITMAHRFFTKFKGLLADNFLSLKERKESRDVFMKMKGMEAVRVIEIELNLIYDVFYTKAFLVESRQSILRLFSYMCVIGSLVFFALLDKKNYKVVDVVITYILLGGAVALDFCAFVMLVNSDWYIIINNGRHTERKAWEIRILTTFLQCFKICQDRILITFRQCFKVCQDYIPTWLLNCFNFWGKRDHKRWSRTIFRYNLLRRCFKDPPSIYEIIRVKRFKDGVVGYYYVEKDKTNEDLVVNFVVDELKKKANLINDDNLMAIKEVCSARGDLIMDDEYCLISDYLKPWTTDIDYDESVLTWHIATDICYHTCTSKSNEKTISTNLSDYMAYLLLRNQSLVSTVVGMSDKRFADTEAEAKKFHTNKRLSSWSKDFAIWALRKWYKYTCQSEKNGETTKEKETKFLKRFCESLLEVNVDIQPIVAKGDKSKSVLFEACRLAKQLKMLGPEKQWMIISKVWVELMCYAAVRCSPRSHIAQLNSGGELITLVWLLMAHHGFGDRFLQNQGFGWTKLIIQK